MTTALITLAILAPFLLGAALIRAAHREGHLRFTADQFRIAGPLTGSFHAEDRDSLRTQHDIDAIRCRWEHAPAWPTSSASGERR
ncbi:hypothetical protein [Mycolicibacterium neoaurum]|uniref:Uncharacterized protein n=1 Tax=Mycolicibacterium neoaurum TaxID=1795 RepID=A0AAV2WSG5_MYCNE|nr:hypothetical protein [Mycolicibacterium neoaurum]TLH49186.1 hypothetical protein C1S81_23695 [Mycolicibacterium neoaurum]CDQ47175.1 hypothetical protein BN1047_05093 [Mycolicibacterium neoaurum]